MTVAGLKGLTNAVTGEPKAMPDIGVNDQVSILLDMKIYVVLGLESLAADEHFSPTLENKWGSKPY